MLHGGGIFEGEVNLGGGGIFYGIILEGRGTGGGGILDSDETPVTGVFAGGAMLGGCLLDGDSTAVDGSAGSDFVGWSRAGEVRPYDLLLDSFASFLNLLFSPLSRSRCSSRSPLFLSLSSFFSSLYSLCQISVWRLKSGGIKFFSSADNGRWDGFIHGLRCRGIAVTPFARSAFLCFSRSSAASQSVHFFSSASSLGRIFSSFSLSERMFRHGSFG